MKKIYFTLTIALAALTLSSCEDFLTKVPETEPSAGSFFSSEAELALWANQFYTGILPTPEDVVEVYADDHMGSGLNAIQKGTRTESSKSWTADTFKPLRNINFMLENLGNCSDADVRAMYAGTAYFFRALFYYQMVQKYGDMPWYGAVLASDDNAGMKKPRDPRGYVMMKVLEDCDKAWELLPEKWSTDPRFHVSKDAAMALKSRAALFEGTFRKYHAGDAFVPKDEETYGDVTVSSEWFLRQAADAASKVMGKKSMYKGNTLHLAAKDTDASYREYFILDDAEATETILARRYNAEILVRYGVQFDMKNARRSATQRFVNHYLQKDGTGIQNRAGWETLDYYDVFQNRDPRMAQSLHGPSYVPRNAELKAQADTPHEVLSWERTISGYRIIKYISDDTHENATTSTADFALFRYGEVLLNYAEAKAELGELTSDDIARTVDVLRERVGMKKMETVPTAEDALMAQYYPNAKGAQKAAILEIRRERTVELFCEGFRQWDLFRWNEGKWLTPKANGGFQGIYIPGVGEYDIDHDGVLDLCVYQGPTKPSVSKDIPASNVIEIGSLFTLTGSNKGNLTYYANENYVWNEGRDYLYPIPADQREVTDWSLSQNPGWDDPHAN